MIGKTNAVVSGGGTSEDLSAELNAQDVALTNLENYVNELPKGDEPDTTAEDGLLDGSLSGEYTNNRITKLRSYAMTGIAITSFNSSSLEQVGPNAFSTSSKLEYCNIPNVTNVVGGASWQRCSALKRLELPKLTSTFGANACRDCEALTYVSLGDTPSIGSSAFAGCTNLQYLVLPRPSEITTLTGYSAFSDSAIENGYGFVYVPDELVGTYKTATNWSYYADHIIPLSELPEGV